jgi:heptose III glucuronosyltransferase
MTPELSMIVPVYNVAPYLGQCFDSLLAQDLTGVEIIVVDDGSTDDCPAILARYAAQCSAIRVIRQENGGLSSARNTGLNHASGKYVAFVDSDDWIAPGFYTRLLTIARDHDLDVVQGNAIYHFEGRRDDHPIYPKSMSGETMPGREYLRARLREGFFKHMVWMYVYRRDLIEQLQLRFVPNQIHEDILWTTRVLLAAERFIYDMKPGYFYRQRLRRRPPDEMDAVLVRVIGSYMDIARGMTELAQSVSDDNELHRLLRWQLVDDALTVFHKLRKLHSSAVRKQTYIRLRKEGFYTLLFKKATLFSQRRRIVRSWIKSYFA